MGYFDFRLERVKSDLAQLKANVPLFTVSSKERESVIKVCDFIAERRTQGYCSTHQF